MLRGGPTDALLDQLRALRPRIQRHPEDPADLPARIDELLRQLCGEDFPDRWHSAFLFFEARRPPDFVESLHLLGQAALPDEIRDFLAAACETFPLVPDDGPKPTTPLEREVHHLIGLLRDIHHLAPGFLETDEAVHIDLQAKLFEAAIHLRFGLLEVFNGLGMRPPAPAPSSP